MEVIKLNARYGYVHTLEPIANNLWQFKADPNAGTTCRIIGEYPNNIKAFDPDGGPYMSVGDKINDYTIKSIRMGGVFELIKE